ncbi:MAG TPA: Ku protein [Ramlibacter sp.]|uniref:Ku protein n=1 Tax=Ramlibacter sp. TaxID=1917967 RepID=UPI002ED11C52
MADTKGMARTSTRSLWKGAITFGLVHIPVGLYSATEETDVDFDWLDRRTMDPVGYKRINKRTGREIDKEDVVKGVEHGKGNDVVLTQKEIAEAYPRTTQTIEIETFVGPALVLNLLRWGGEIRSWEDLPLPPEGRKAGIKEAEMKMAKQLIGDRSGHWSAAEFRDSFHDAIMALVEKKAKAGDTEAVEPLEEAPEARGAEVIDLTELLRRSLQGGSRSAPPARKAVAKKAAARTTRAKRAA